MGVKRHLSSSRFNSKCDARGWVWDRLQAERLARQV